MRKVACDFYAFENDLAHKKFSLRKVMFGMASRDCSRPKVLTFLQYIYEHSTLGEYFQKFKEKAVFPLT